KETWESVIQYLFEFRRGDPSGAPITEIWSAESPNHGESAAINEKPLLERSHGLSGYQWGRGIQALLKSGLISSTHIASVGHSAGACVMVLSTDGYPLDDLPYFSMILIEPTTMTKELLEDALKKPLEMNRVTDAVRKRRDIWESRESAGAWLKVRFPWKRWDARSLDRFVKYGLRDMPTAAYPDRERGVTLSCTREQEALGYAYEQDGVDAMERLKGLCRHIPVHCIFGAQFDFVPDRTRRAICDETQGRRMASITTIPNTGHFVTQEKPYELAHVIWTALNGRHTPSVSAKM
ncbi:alpha/beta-hydrolase, partial [Mycena crocata]